MNSRTLPGLVSDGQIHAEVRGPLALITLNRPQALNALSLPMIRDLMLLLQHWQHDDAVAAVLVRRHPFLSPGRMGGRSTS
jgi:enoyl-CoA hydratase/carnithine racemase